MDLLLDKKTIQILLRPPFFNSLAIELSRHISFQICSTYVCFGWSHVCLLDINLVIFFRHVDEKKEIHNSTLLGSQYFTWHSLKADDLNLCCNVFFMNKGRDETFWSHRTRSYFNEKSGAQQASLNTSRELTSKSSSQLSMSDSSRWLLHHVWHMYNASKNL